HRTVTLKQLPRRVDGPSVIPPPPPAERDPLPAVERLEILDTPAEERFDRVTRLATTILGVPIALISLIDADRQWFKSAVGVDVAEIAREMSFCAHAVADDCDRLVV